MIELRDAVASRRCTAEWAVTAALDRLSALNPRLNAFIDVFPEQALAQAREIDARLTAGRPVGVLAGVPVAVKDNICLDFGRTTCGSRFLEHYSSPYTATAAARLLAAGAIVIGKTNLDEFAMGSSGEHSAFGPTRNPWDAARTPGGSSSGSAAAVAARIVPAALGSDTGGSIRQPAGFCGLVGYKPTYGRVSRYGLVAYASSLDQIGPLTRTVADAALLAEVIGGHDPHDSTSLSDPTPGLTESVADALTATCSASAGRGAGAAGGLTIAVPVQARSPGNHPAVAAALEHAANAFRAAGATVIDVDLRMLDHAIAAYYIVATAEASSNLARFDGVRYGRRAALTPADAGHELTAMYCRSRSEGFGPEVRRRIMLGTHVLSSGYYDAYYVTALKARRLIAREFERAFAGGDVSGARADALLMPSSPGPAFRLGEKSGPAADPLALYLEDVYTVAVNLAGLPAVTIPFGSGRHEQVAGRNGGPDAFEVVGAPGLGDSLPVGVQLIAPAMADESLLRIAALAQYAAR